MRSSPLDYNIGILFTNHYVLNREGVDSGLL